MPKRTFEGAFLVAAVAALVGVASLAGCSGSSGAQGQAPAPSTTASPSTPSEPTPSDSTTPTPSRTALATTSTPHSAPWKDPDADFGWVHQATTVSGGVEITFDRASWLLPDQIAAWNKANPGHTVEAADDYAIGNVSTKLRTFLVRRGAVIFGSVALTGDETPVRMTTAQLAKALKANPEGVTCWLYHQYGGLTGDVVQLEEQFRP
jgi:hypothetical protein